MTIEAASEFINVPVEMLRSLQTCFAQGRQEAVDTSSKTMAHLEEQTTQLNQTVKSLRQALEDKFTECITLSRRTNTLELVEKELVNTKAQLSQFQGRFAIPKHYV